MLPMTDLGEVVQDDSQSPEDEHTNEEKADLLGVRRDQFGVYPARGGARAEGR